MLMFENSTEFKPNGVGVTSVSGRSDFLHPAPTRELVRIDAKLQFMDGAGSALQSDVFLVPKGKVLFIDYVFLQGTLPLDQRMSLLLGKPGTPLAYVDVVNHSFLESESLQIAAHSLSVHLKEGDRLAVGSRRSSRSGDSSVFEILIIGHLIQAHAV